MGKYSLKCCGAAREVTGSMHLLQLDNISILLDAGAFQGPDSHEKNAQRLPFNPKKVDFIFLSHAHLDHVGRLPVLCKKGFQGKIIATRTTKEIGMRVLEDNLKIQQEEAQEPLFSESDLEKVEDLFDIIDDENFMREYPEKNLKVRFLPSEHILGSVSILFETPISLLYTGDLGGESSSLHMVPKPPEKCDYLIIESTYGNRALEKSRKDVLKRLQTHVQDVVKKQRGRLLIPVFSVDRAEEILYSLCKLKVNEKIYLDTPMGVDILDIYEREKYHLSQLANEFQNLDTIDFDAIFRPPNFERVNSNKRSEALASLDKPCIILASSGMLEGGRIMNYLPYILPNKNNMVLFSGFQAEDTLGRLILDGNKEVEVEENPVQVHAKIDKIEGLSAHADRNMLLSYLDGFKLLPSKVFIVHGEEESSVSLAQAIEERFRIRTVVPYPNKLYEITPGEVREKEITKPLGIEGVHLNFEKIQGKNIAMFMGGVIEENGNYRLVKLQELETLLKPYREGISWAAQSSTVKMDIVSSTDAEFDVNAFKSNLLEYSNSGYISKGLIRDLIDATERGTPDYLKVIKRRVKHDRLLHEPAQLKKNGTSLEESRRDTLSIQLETILIKSASANMRIVYGTLMEILEEIS